jgi:glycosyltransferase involved in cell wall biosynthesis
MASGVPVVAEDAWGWREMIEHGVTGFLGRNGDELTHWAATLVRDDSLRLKIAHQAYRRLVDELANPHAIFCRWKELFESLRCREPVSTGS